jgi:hypothetical protein
MKKLLRDIGKGGVAGLLPLLLVYWTFGGFRAAWIILMVFVVAAGALIASYLVREQEE